MPTAAPHTYAQLQQTSALDCSIPGWGRSRFDIIAAVKWKPAARQADARGRKDLRLNVVGRPLKPLGEIYCTAGHDDFEGAPSKFRLAVQARQLPILKLLPSAVRYRRWRHYTPRRRLGFWVFQTNPSTQEPSKLLYSPQQ